MKQLRIEMTGQINDWLSYRYRQRLNKGILSRVIATTCLAASTMPG